MHGLGNAAYSGGTAQNCAWHHPLRCAACRKRYVNPSPVRLAWCDTLIIGAGSYQIGINAPGANAYSHARGLVMGCVMASVPSGTSARRRGFSAPVGKPAARHRHSCGGSERATEIVRSRQQQCRCRLSSTSPITPRASNRISAAAVRTHAIARPLRTATGRQSASWPRIRTMVTLQDLKIHGLANTGILAGRLSNWTVNRVSLIANGWAGWSNDLGEAAGSSDAGNMAFTTFEVGFNGCGESWPGKQVFGCWGQMEAATATASARP